MRVPLNHCVGPAGRRSPIAHGRCPVAARRGFTMMEVALCLAIIGFALVAIIGVLPRGMNSQQETRQATIISEDATMFMEAIRGGARGLDDLTNYVFAITNYYQTYNAAGRPTMLHPLKAGYTFSGANIGGASKPGLAITNGLRIIGLMSTPEFTLYPPDTKLAQIPVNHRWLTAYTSNRVYAYVRSISGGAADKPPQNNDILRGSSFSYRVLCVNAPPPGAPGVLADQNAVYDQQLEGNLRELRLLFSWPLLPNFDVGNYKQNFRADVSGALVITNDVSKDNSGMWLYFCQPQSFTNSPYTP